MNLHGTSGYSKLIMHQHKLLEQPRTKKNNIDSLPGDFQKLNTPNIIRMEIDWLMAIKVHRMFAESYFIIEWNQTIRCDQNYICWCGQWRKFRQNVFWDCHLLLSPCKWHKLPLMILEDSHLGLWRHEMEGHYTLLALCEGNPPIAGGSPNKG